MYVGRHVRTYVCIYVRTYVCMYVCMHVCVNVRMSVYIYIYLDTCLHVCKGVCMCCICIARLVHSWIVEYNICTHTRIYDCEHEQVQKHQYLNQ